MEISCTLEGVEMYNKQFVVRKRFLLSAFIFFGLGLLAIKIILPPVPVSNSNYQDIKPTKVVFDKDKNIRKEFYSNGQLASEIYYKNGLPHGVSKWLDKSGIVDMVAVYEDGDLIAGNTPDRSAQCFRESHYKGSYKDIFADFKDDNLIYGNYLKAGAKFDEKLLRNLQNNQNVLKLYLKAVKEPNADNLFGEIQKPISPWSCLPRFFKYVNLADLSLIHSKILEQQNDYKSAGEYLLANLYLFVQLSQQKEGTLLSEIMYTIMLNKIFLPISQSIVNDSYDNHYLQNLLHSLKVIETNRPAFAQIMEQEFVFSWSYIEILQLEAKYEPDYNERFWDIFMKEFKSLDKQLMEYIKNNDKVMVQKILDESKQVLGNFSKDKKTFNADDFSFPFKQDPEQAADYAKIFFGMSKPNYYTTEDYIRIFESQRYVLELAAAVKLFYLENNKLPSSLEDLKPKYLEGVPKDYFNGGKDYHYQTQNNGFLLYGVGPDQEDQDGQVEYSYDGKGDALKIKGDIIFRYHWPEKILGTQ